MKKLRFTVPWWVILGGITLLILVWTSPWMRLYYRDLFRFKAWVLALDREMNFGVWWSAALFLFGAGLLYETASRHSTGLRRAYSQLAVVLLAFAIDEIASFHEWLSGLGGWLVLAPFGLLVALILIDSLRGLWTAGVSRNAFWLLLIGFVLLAVFVPIQEYLEHNFTTRKFGDRYGRYIEETTEYLGAWLILLGAVRSRRGRLGGGLASVIPDPAGMPHVVPALAAGFLAHLLAMRAPLLGIGEWHGSPPAVYPVVSFFALACFAYWVPSHRPGASTKHPEIRAFWRVAGAVFLLCSIGAMQNLWGLVDGIVPGIQRPWFKQPVAVYLFLIVAAWFTGYQLRRALGWNWLWLLGLPLTIFIFYEVQNPDRHQLAAGLLALVSTLAFMHPMLPAGRRIPDAVGSAAVSDGPTSDHRASDLGGSRER